MKIKFDDDKVKVLFEDFSLMAQKKGFDLTKIIKKRYDQIKAAETFYEYLKIGLGKPHRLKEDKDGLYGVSLTGHIRLIIEPVSDDLSPESLKKCKEVIIKGAVDYHGKKERIYIP